MFDLIIFLKQIGYNEHTLPW